MTKIILCEGSTDAVLISYYLITVNKWVPKNNKENKFKTPFAIPFDSSQNVYWYNRGGDFLAIWAVGGIDRFPSALAEILKINGFISQDRIDKIVVISDHDHEQSENNLIKELNEIFAAASIVATLENNAWTRIEQITELLEELPIDVACLVIPFERLGAIETFMLNSLSEQNHEAIVVQHARNAVSTLSSEKYLLKKRDRLKAELGTTLALMFPEKVFSLIDDLIRSIRWEDYKQVRREFSLLDSL